MAWKTLKRKTIKEALTRAIDSIADLIQVIELRGADTKIDTAQIESLLHKLKHLVEVE